jgi:VanZ family protein
MKRIQHTRLACFLFTLFLASIVYAADTGIGKPVFDFVRYLPLGDKVSHFLLMGTLSILANLSLQTRTLGGGRLAPGIGTVLVTTVVVAEEFSQIWVPARSFDLLDLTADFLGIAGGEMAARALWSRIVSVGSRE